MAGALRSSQPSAGLIDVALMPVIGAAASAGATKVGNELANEAFKSKSVEGESRKPQTVPDVAQSSRTTKTRSWPCGATANSTARSTASA